MIDRPSDMRLTLNRLQTLFVGRKKQLNKLNKNSFADATTTKVHYVTVEECSYPGNKVTDVRKPVGIPLKARAFYKRPLNFLHNTKCTSLKKQGYASFQSFYRSIFSVKKDNATKDI